MIIYSKLFPIYSHTAAAAPTTPSLPIPFYRKMSVTPFLKINRAKRALSPIPNQNVISH
jgi:hypothetical protein